MPLTIDRAVGLAFVVALAVSAIVAFPVFRLLVAAKSKQTISPFLGESHQAKQGTPTMGGLIILLGLGTALAILGRFPELALVMGFAAIGFVDDYVIPKVYKAKRGLGWVPKLILQCLAVWGPLYMLPEVPPAGWVWLGFSALFMANAYNFADGLDGLAGGLAILLAAGIALLASWSGQAWQVAVCAAMAGAAIPFLFLNAPPARLFMGDVGALPLGALIGWLIGFGMGEPIALLTKSTGFRPHDGLWQGSDAWFILCAWLLLSFVLIAELVPVPLQILSVKLRKGKRLFPRTPIHHAFEFKGWPESRITWTFLLVQLICVALATSLVAWAPPFIVERTP